MSVRTNPDPTIYCKMVDMLDHIHSMLDNGKLVGASDKLFDEIGVLISVANGDVDVSVYDDEIVQS